MTITRRLFTASALAATALASGRASAQAGQTVKIAWLDPLSGMLANIGQNSLRTFQFMAEKVSASNPAKVKFEIVPFDNKLNPQESLTALKAIIDQGIRYVTQGNGSSVAGALIDAIEKHNQRNPGKEIVFLNNAAVDPDFTNSVELESGGNAVGPFTEGQVVKVITEVTNSSGSRTSAERTITIEPPIV